MVMLVPGFFELAFDVLDSLIGLLKLNACPRFFALQRFELFAELAAVETRPERREFLRQLLIVSIGLEFFVLFIVGGPRFVVIQAVEMGLDAFPRAARNVVVPNRPKRQRHQQADADNEDTAVGFFLFFLVVASFRPADSLTTLLCAQARGPKKKLQARSASRLFLRPWKHLSQSPRKARSRYPRGPRLEEFSPGRTSRC